ncbi:IS66 family insertion sequence element accessory protein TnpA [Archangium violaceum]|uniref:Transposase n=1 Tax=Archangium violaceum Cb vi76 TaxID=1406225 RepID=A0A084SH65_9BACT|nr:transposase [Archangium violaceum]KFA87800.1 transposase [Archangium violaceum Cb vi76]
MTTSIATTKTEPAWLEAARRPRWTPEVAAQVVRAWEEEGGTQSAFMRKHGLPRERLRFWTKRREGKEGARKAMSFVPVEVAPAGRSEARRGHGEAVQVEVDGVRVRVEEGASQELVARVLRAVKEVQGC